MVKLAGGSTATGLSLTQTASNLLYGITATDLRVAGGNGGASNIITNNQNGGFTIPQSANAVPFYAYQSSDGSEISQLGPLLINPDGSISLKNTAAAPSGAANLEKCYYDVATQMRKCSFNNSAFGQMVTAAPCFTSQKTESGADANVLTCAIPAQAGSYRVRFTLFLSAANAATLGWTATWHDPSGGAQAPTNLMLINSTIAGANGSAAPALTFTTSTNGSTFYGYADIDVDNSATSIVVKLTFSGTSFAGKASGTVERII